MKNRKKREHFNPQQASKQLGNIKLKIENSSFCVDVVWCRALFVNLEKPNVSRHRHRFYELHYCISGRGIFESEKGKIELTAGKMFLVNPGIYHTLLEYSEDFYKYVLGFSITVKEENLETGYLMRAFEENPGLAVDADPLFGEYVERMLEEIYYTPPGFVSCINAYLELLFFQIAREFKPMDERYTPELKSNDRDQMIAMIENYIEYNIANGSSAAAISREVSMSTKQINRILMRYRGVTLRGFCNQIRLKKAKRLLEETQLSLQDISLKLGFTSEYNFIRFFKREEGMPPGQYRRDFRQI